jgi:hypothetical protein
VGKSVGSILRKNRYTSPVIRGTGLSNEVIYTNLVAKPKSSNPTSIPEAPAEVPVPQVKRIQIGWGPEGQQSVAARNSAIAERELQPKLGLGDRASNRFVRVKRSVLPESQSIPLGTPRMQMGYVDRGSKLERIRGQRSLSERLEQHTERSILEHLTILHSEKFQGYWIANAATGNVFVRQAFATLKHCYEAAADLERMFNMAQVLVLRPPETLERMEDLVREHWLREKVEGIV